MEQNKTENRDRFCLQLIVLVNMDGEYNYKHVNMYQLTSLKTYTKHTLKPKIIEAVDGKDTSNEVFTGFLKGRGVLRN